MKVFKNKWFNRWARGENITDAELCVTAAEIIAGQFDADLGGYLFKKRLARAGTGKSGGYRTIIGYRKTGSDRVIFLYGFAKNTKSNISGKEEAALSLVAADFLAATDQQIRALVASGVMWEVKDDE